MFAVSFFFFQFDNLREKRSVSLSKWVLPVGKILVAHRLKIAGPTWFLPGGAQKTVRRLTQAKHMQYTAMYHE